MRLFRRSISLFAVTLAIPGLAHALCRDWDVTFRLTSATGSIGSIQVFTDYSDSGGAFEGARADVSCTPSPSTLLFAAND